MVPGVGLEPTRLATADFETIASRCESISCRVFAGLLGDGWGLLGVAGERCRHFAAIFHRGDRVEFDRIFEVVRGEVGIAHGHLDVGMAEDALQHQDVAAAHHEVAGEGVAQHMGALQTPA